MKRFEVVANEAIIRTRKIRKPAILSILDYITHTNCLVLSTYFISLTKLNQVKRFMNGSKESTFAVISCNVFKQ